ncbi:hypothetical protein HRG84_19265 [Flavisolibacter sp. BT320]|nr:hypothetical protein [Flavisolibacter longurius]
MIAYLNELSLPTFHADVEAIQRLQEFGDCYTKAREHGVRDIRTPEGLYGHSLAPNYTIYNWFEDNRADEDLRTLFKSVLGTLPNIEDLLDEYQRTTNSPLTCTFGGVRCTGLALASKKIFDTICFSMDFPHWQDSIYTIDIEIIFEDEHGDVVSRVEKSDTKHISCLAHVDEHRSFITQKIADTIESGRQMWETRETLFPNLIFCENVRGQLAAYNANTMGFQTIIARLFDLQSVASAMNGTPITPEHFRTLTSPESDSRIKKYGAQLTFRCPDGHDRLFTWHSRFTPGAGRIHFVAFENQNIIIIGYVGSKIQ